MCNVTPEGENSNNKIFPKNKSKFSTLLPLDMENVLNLSKSIKFHWTTYKSFHNFSRIPNNDQFLKIKNTKPIHSSYYLPSTYVYSSSILMYFNWHVYHLTKLITNRIFTSKYERNKYVLSDKSNFTPIDN